MRGSLPRRAPEPREPAPILPLDRELSTYRCTVNGGGGARDNYDLTDGSPPSPPRRELSTERARRYPDEVLASVAAQLRSLGFNGARWYVRCHEPALIVEAVAEVRACMREGDDVRNPAGLVRYLVAQAEAAEATEAQQTSQTRHNQLPVRYAPGAAGEPVATLRPSTRRAGRERAG